MFCSYIIPTIGRETLDRAVMSVLEQDYVGADFEVIVVNDSGSPLPRASWHASPQVRMLNTQQCERSVARNSGAALARGDYLAFLDDDDWLLPGALGHFWQLACQEKEAAWLYGGIRIVDSSDEILAEINSGISGNCFAQIMGGAWTPIQASMIKTRSFFRVGGFSPLICGTEDEDLCRRIAYHGALASTTAVVACLFRGQNWHSSTNYLRAAEDTKYSRNLVLAEPGSFRRLLSSAGTSYWYGRIFRVYLSTVKWNFHHKRLFTGLSRLFYAILWFLASTNRLVSREFWQGLQAEHVPDSLHFVMQRYEQHHATEHKISAQTRNKKIL